MFGDDAFIRILHFTIGFMTALLLGALLSRYHITYFPKQTAVCYSYTDTVGPAKPFMLGSWLVANYQPKITSTCAHN